MFTDNPLRDALTYDNELNERKTVKCEFCGNSIASGIHIETRMFNIWMCDDCADYMREDVEDE